MKALPTVMLSILLSSLIFVGARVAGPIVPIIRQTLQSPEANDNDSKNANSVTVPKSPLNQAAKGAVDNDNADVMWVMPSRVGLSKELASIGYRFNVTVWLNMTQDIGSYQIGLLYNRTQLRCDRAGFTDGRTSIYFEGHYSGENMIIDTGFLGNGSIMAYEGCIREDYVSGPHVGSLIWAEFEVLTLPSSNMSFTSKFDISTKVSVHSLVDYTMTWVRGPSFGDRFQMVLSDGDYEILSTSDLSVSVNPVAVTMYVGQSQVFASNVTGGTPPYTLQWYADYDLALDGTGSTWTFTPNTLGFHQVSLEVTDSSNTFVTSNFVSVDVASANTHNVTLNARCDTEGANVNVPIMMDGSSTGLNTPQTFTGLTGTHSFAVSSLDSNGHSFRLWDQLSASTTILLSDGGTYTAHYGGDQWPPDAMWVEPSNMSLSVDSATVGYRFNITIWLNMTQDIFAYQVGLLYNRTQLRCDRAGFTDGGTSEYFTGHHSSAWIAPIDTSFLGNGSIMASECCMGGHYVSGPRVGSLIWAEFEVLTLPSSNMSFTSKFDISRAYPRTTWVRGPSLDRIQIAPHDGNYEILGLDVSVSLTTTTMQSNASGFILCVEHMRGSRKASYALDSKPRL